jgi:Tfp pilus assembly protein PilF
MEIQTEKGLQEALGYLKAGNPAEARKILGTLLENDLDCWELIFTARCCSFWIEYIQQLSVVEDSFERGESLLAEWKTYQSFILQEKKTYQPALFAVQHGIFSLALENYSKLFDERDAVQKADIYRKAGICYKKLGQFENAKNCLTEANNAQGELAPVLAELADCYSLCGEDRPGKVLFREAFFVDPQRIDLGFLDSELIRCLITKTAEKGYSGAQLQAWIPVYGVLWGILNVKRELRSQEVGKLKQEIYALENEMKDPAADSAVLTPRLINLYFWLIDHYVLTNDNSRKINEVLLKVKILDSTIYDLYVK